jgi:octaprenyl-diphosphate synthase
VKHINQLISAELRQFEEHFKAATKSKVPLLDRIMQYIVKRKGKQIRPMFVLLCAKLGGEVNDKTYRAASLVELLHTATLVHDDVVDESFERRGFFSLNALWKNKIAVLVGDYLLAKGLLLSIDNDDFYTLKILSTAVKQMSESELLQIEKSRNLNLQEDEYYHIIKGKTASLLSSACGAGASSTFENKEDVERLSAFGEKVGMAFQIKDDLFDYGSANVGKPTGNDIKEKKLTLPLIHTLNNCAPALRKKIIYIVKNKNTDKKQVAFIIDAVKQSGGIEYAINKMNTFRDDALALLHHYPQTETRNALEELVRYTTDRKY